MSKAIYTLYFDEKGYGPTALELQLKVFEIPESLQPIVDERRQRLRAAGIDIVEEPDPIGVQFKRPADPHGWFNTNSAPVDAGLYFNDRESLVEFHRQLGELLAKTEAKP